MPQDSSIAQPILNYRDKLIDFARKAKAWGESGRRPAPTDPNDTRWEVASDSFRSPAYRGAKAAEIGGVAGGTTIPVKRIPKRTPTRTAQPRVSGRR
jgi:hypothetical protein